YPDYQYQELGIMENFETIGRVFKIEHTKLGPSFFERMGLAFGDSLQELIVYWKTTDENMTMQNTGRLIDLLEALPKLTRISMCFNGNCMRKSVANRLFKVLNKHEKLNRLDI